MAVDEVVSVSILITSAGLNLIFILRLIHLNKQRSSKY
jgi:hypothetical protein